MEQIATLRRQLSEASSGRTVAEGALVEAEARDAVYRQRQNELQASLQVMYALAIVQHYLPDELLTLTLIYPNCNPNRRYVKLSTL